MNNFQLKCFIVDDEPLAVELMRSYIEQTPFLKLVGCFSNALDVLTAMKTQPVDLLFLDIQMPEWTGLQLALLIDAFKTKIIFTTAFDHYALDGFKADALDYLLKPISYADFLKAAQKAQRYIGDAPAKTPEGNLIVRVDYQWRKINYNDILYFEAMRDYVAIHTRAGEKIITLSTLHNIAAMLPDALFLRVHRSFIVHLLKIQTIERKHIVFGKIRIPISNRSHKELMARLST
ncbi:MAG: LytTR family DNA-binding domain-containing protein [Prevotellaceae bacterium]|jgi:DNA-binding LytR/AlgR family response regulator|nr:LytTR family DNA-binding domain-containing protein [Prevotellaceae bacterium]